jgi:hypothetical protein
MSSSKKSRTDKEMINFDELKAEEESYGETSLLVKERIK